MRRFRAVATPAFTFGVGFWLASFAANAQGVKEKAEAEGKLMFYATFNAADSKTFVDGFKQLYPKIDAAYYRSNGFGDDGADRNRKSRRSESLGRGRDHQFLRPQLKETRTVRGLRLTGAQILPRRLQRSAGELDVQLYELCARSATTPVRVPKTSVPKSFNDLLKPEWKGQIAMESRPYEWFGTMLKAMGEEKGLAYMRELAKQTQLARRQNAPGAARRRG